METLHPEKLVLNDICQEMSSCFTDLLGSGQATFLAGDAESLPFQKDRI
mgnify:FL=1